MKIAIICSNYFNIKKDTANGTAIFDYSFISELAKHAQGEALSITAFASGASELPVPVISIAREPLSASEALVAGGKHALYEQALLSKAFSMQDEFDLFHINIGDGDIAMPFSPFVKKPIIVTIHNVVDTDYMRTFFSFYRDRPNVFFVSASDAQRTRLPDLRYLTTIYHGIDPAVFAFSERGGNALMWAGRLVPEKGADVVADIAIETRHDAKLFGIPRKQHQRWLEEAVLSKRGTGGDAPRISLETGLDRYGLIGHYQSSKAFVLPMSAEESFGLVLAESMSCGTPVIAFARGSIPEVIEDGKTGFIVNYCDDDIRGDWIVKKTGAEGLHEAVERIYAMPTREYMAMRAACRERVINRFTIERMTKEYIRAYREAAQM
jgi:glycosyltransferase involved in cell wall biosynthesis